MIKTSFLTKTNQTKSSLNLKATVQATYPFELLEVFPQESDWIFWLVNTQLDETVFHDRHNVRTLHVLCALAQALLLFEVRRHVCVLSLPTASSCLRRGG